MAVDRLRLLHGPYVAPAVKRGDALFCEKADREVKVGGLSDAPIQWPRRLKTGTPSLILCGDLIRAVRTESVIAVAHWWGVNAVTVWKWRKALGVPQVNEGTGRLYRDYHPEKLPDDVAAVGRENAAKPEAVAKMAASKTGKPAHPRAAEIIREVGSRPKTEAWRAEASRRNLATWEARRADPEAVARYRLWTPEEDALLGTDLDKIVAAKLNRPPNSVTQRRRKLGVPRKEPTA